MSLTLADAKEYIKEDSDDVKVLAYITDLIETSQIYIDFCAGEAYKTDEKAAKLAILLQKKIIADMYDQRRTEVPNNTKQDKITQSILDKLSNYYVEPVVEVVI